MNTEEILAKAKEIEGQYLSLMAIIEERTRRRLELEEECRKQGLDPDKIEEILASLADEKIELEDQLVQAIEKLTEELNKYETKS